MRLDREQIDAIQAAMIREDVEKVNLDEGADGRLLVNSIHNRETLKPLALTTRKQRVEQPVSA